MKNVTISMPDDLALWVRVEAAKADLSVSRWIAERLSADRAKAFDPATAIEHLLTHAGFAFLARAEDGHGIDRAGLDEEMWRERFSRFNDDDLRGGSDRADQTQPRPGVAEPLARFERGGDQSTSNE